MFITLRCGNTHSQGDLFDEVKRRGGRLPENQVVQGVSQMHCLLAVAKRVQLRTNNND